jgi:2',3'-cyclic-nucleotide 2'-phosphodiesterase (5'-nucleotidase family)
MYTNKPRRVLTMFLTLAVMFSMFASAVMAVPSVTAAGLISFTILHTNDFHGQLEKSGSNPGLPSVAYQVGVQQAAVGGAQNTILVDGGDEMQGSLLSNLSHGAPVIDAFNQMGYSVATFGNHEFDWGMPNLNDRTAQATYPFVSANIVKGSCDASNWTVPDQFKVVPYVIQTLNTTSGTVRVGFIGVTTTETPIITVSTATTGLCFKDPADSILHYYDTVKGLADVVIVLSHLGYNDGGYGYGIPVYGDLTLANKLLTAGKYVPLIIGGHSHSNLTAAGTVTLGGKTTTVVQAYYNGRQLGRADLTLDTSTGNVNVVWQKISVPVPAANPGDPAGPTENASIKTLIQGYSNDPTYQALINQPIGYSSVDLPRLGGTVDNMMGTFVDDAIYNYLNTDAYPSNDIDIFFNNAGGIRTDWCYIGGVWTNAGCVAGTHAPALLTYGNMFTILPFGNATVVGEMTGAQILQVLNQAPLVSNGAIQPAGLKFKYYAYRDSNPGPQPYAWGAFDYCVVNKVTKACEPLDMNKTYKVGTNEFLAPGGGDGYGGFKYMTNITYWGDMLNAVDAYVSAIYGTAGTAYKGPNGDGTLDNRILRDGTDTCCGSIIPITILHNNDSHGNLAKGTYVGMTQLATLIKQERLHNPTRTLLLDGGDQIQGDSMMYYFKSSYSGFASDGTPLPDALQTNPMIAVMNALGYDAMTLGNHEFNYGSSVFDGIFKQALFPLLAANITDTGAYGLATVGPGGQGVQPYITLTKGGIKIAILGLGNHRVPNYELPSNIVGLTFSNPITTAQNDVPALRANNDVVIALTHIGFTTNPKSVEVDDNVDTNLAAQVSGIDAIIGAHSHTNPASPEAPYKFLPTIVGNPNGAPVLVTQAYRYNNTLGEVVIGVRAKAGGGYEVVSQVGQYITVTMSTPEDPQIKAIVDPYVAQLATYNNTVVGQTTVPIDALQAFTQETNGANMQADASVFELAKHGITVDFHLSGAMTNSKIASSATPANPITLKISDMFTAMPYENSLVVLSMNGPQLKAVLERAYRNYYYYKYVPGYGGYSYYTTCMIDTNAGNQITYDDEYPSLPNGNNVVALSIGGVLVNFNDAAKYYDVSTVNYLAAGSCNFNNAGVSLWPLNQIVHDTQYYVRDAVIDYTSSMGTVSPAIEGRLQFGKSDYMSHWAAPWISRLYIAGLTSGCSTFPLIYCPENPVTNAQMAIFLLRGMFGSTYTPPAGTGNVFGDVPLTYWAVNWIELLYTLQISDGCGFGNYCPDAPVTRTQMAIFLLRAKHGVWYTPPAATGVFADVPADQYGANWIEELAAEGITAGCGGGNFCPERPVTRAEMAVFLVHTFNLP